MRKPATAFLALAAIHVGCSQSEQSNQDALDPRPAVQQWAKNSLQPHEILLCTATHEADYFYVSRASLQTFWVGSQLALDLAKPATASSMLEQWSFRTPDGVSLIAAKMPKNIRTTHPTAESPFVESVTEYALEERGPTVLVSVTVKRCPSADCSMTSNQSDAAQYRTDVCAIDLAALNGAKAR